MAICFRVGTGLDLEIKIYKNAMKMRRIRPMAKL